MSNKSFHIKVGPHRVAVNFVKLLDTGLYGLFTYSRSEIQLDESLAGSILKETFLHEAAHLVSEAYGLGLDEQQVRTLGMGMAQALEGFLDLSSIEEED